MSDYSRQDDFSAKTGQTILGGDVDAEFDALLIAVNSKTDEAREGAADGIATLGAGGLVPVGISGLPTSAGGQIPEASETTLGAVELATTAEVTTGTDLVRVITAAELKTHLDTVMAAADGTGLSEASRVLSLDLNELGTETTIAAGDFLAMVDITDSGSQKITFANLESALNIASLTGYVADQHIAHSGVTITAGAGMTGGGAINASRTLNVVANGTSANNPVIINADDIDFDMSSLTTMNGNALAATDRFLVWDASASAPKAIQLQNAGLVVNDVVSASNKTFVDTDVNQVWTYNHASDALWDIDTGVGETGDWIIIVQKAAGSVDWSGSTATINQENSHTFTRAADAVVTLLCIATDVWVAYGGTAST